jgi:MFS family permease
MVAIRNDIRDLFVIQESPVQWPVAISAGLAMGLPIAILTILGQPELGLIACTGGFAALYLSNRSRRERVVLLLFIVAGLIASAAIGVAVSGSIPLSLAILFVITVIGSIILLGFGAGPPGSIFFMLVAGASIRLAAPIRLGGIGFNGGLVIGMVALGAVIAYVIVLIPLLHPSVRQRDLDAHRARGHFHFDVGGDMRAILIRLTLASAIAVLVSAPLGVHRTYWVLLTVIAILQNGRRLRLTALRGIHRVLGTLVGLGLFALLLQMHLTGLWLALLLAVLMFVVQIVVIRNYGLALIFITPLALLFASNGDPGDAGTITVVRVVDTLLGAGIAMIVLLAALLVRRYLPNAYRRIEG